MNRHFNILSQATAPTGTFLTRWKSAVEEAAKSQSIHKQQLSDSMADTQKLTNTGSSSIAVDDEDAVGMLEEEAARQSIALPDDDLREEQSPMNDDEEHFSERSTSTDKGEDESDGDTTAI